MVKTVAAKPALHNPHLDGRPFFLTAGEVGILLVHGYTATAWEVRPLADRLHAQGYTVAGPLLAGHGTQAADLNRVHWWDWVMSGAAMYQRLTAVCRQVFVAGQSTGGLVALYLASQFPAVAGVIGYAPAIRLTMTPGQVLLLRLLAPFVSQLDRSSLDCAGNWQGYPGLPLRGAVQLLNFQQVVRRRLHLIRQPLLIFQGRLDNTVHPAAGELILRAAGSAIKQQQWLAQTSHAVPLDKEIELVTAVTLAFLSRVLAQTHRPRIGQLGM
jgi:carboxylesterase